MKLIPLSRGLHAMVDDEDYEELSQFRWHAASPPGRTWYARRNVRLEGPRRFRGRLPYAMELMHFRLTGFAVTDHRDGNGLNNQRANLRDGSIGNTRSARLRRDNTSGYRGVRRNGRNWQALTTVDRQRRYLGTFTDPADAARAYDEAARELHGPFAALNFPRPGERSALTGEVLPA